MIRTHNPVLSRQGAFTPANGPQGSPQDQYQAPYQSQQYGQQPQQQGFGRQPSPGRMTMDDVITKTGITLGLVILTAAASFLLMPKELLMPVAVGASLATVVITFIAAFRRTIPAPLVLLFGVLEGVMVGGISAVFEMFYPGIVVQAVLGTLVAAVLTLGAYKFLNLRVSGRALKILGIATLSFAGLMLVNFLCALGGINLGLRAGMTGPVGWLPWVVSILAIVLCVFNLVSDFQYIEQGVDVGAPANQSWKAALGLTATLVWLYVEMLRLISYIRR